MNPFELAPSHASRIGGLGGALPAPENGYAFRTKPLFVPAGEVGVTLTFEGLQASKGVLLIEISGGEEGARRQLQLRTVSLVDLAAAGGVEHIALMNGHGDAYVVAGHIYDDTDAIAESLSVRIVVNALPATIQTAGALNTMARVPRLAGLDLPSFEHPTSQTWSKEQMGDPAFQSACNIFGLEVDAASWSAAYVFQAIRYLLGNLSGLKGFGAGLHAEIISGGFGAEQAEVVGHPSLDPAHWPPAKNFDFAWLIFEVPIIHAGHLFWMINLLLDRLRPGGVLAVAFTFEHGRMPREQCEVLTRGDVEVFALRLLGQGHSVAQLKFRAGNQPLPVGTRTPFGLMAQRAA
ncbi:hypothetical protein [Sphingobium indicum]|uniref:Uncharacterized protein n=2 Tax=Sphingobium indicum TaxID=332055 RepID=A0A1L5BQT3_SPHIB|nr:hypothetical protein SIDU_12410 [Sphingobium indicum B90A]